MNLVDSERLREHIKGLSEKEVWLLLLEYFHHREIKAYKVHRPGEGGMDLVALVDQGHDFLRMGYYILVQAKKDKLTLNGWRKDILYTLLETPYYTIRYPGFEAKLPRRILLVITDSVTPHALDSIREFNNNHKIIVELWQLDDLIKEFEVSGFARLKLEQITGVGVEEVGAPVSPIVGTGRAEEEAPMPPAVGE